MSYEHFFVCYTTQNFLKALVLAYQRFEAGESSKILLLLRPEQRLESFLEQESLWWTTIEFIEDDNPYVRVRRSDRARAAQLLGKLSRKAYFKLRRKLFKGGQRQHILDIVDEGRRVYLFLEKTYYSNHILAHRPCVLVEEGLATYRPYASRLGEGHSTRYPGSHPNVQEVWLLRPGDADASIAHKVRPVDFDYAGLPPQVGAAIRRLFGSLPAHLPSPCALIVGQAWCCGNIEFSQVLELYERLIEGLHRMDLEVHLKPHPNEELKVYQGLPCKLLSPARPLELIGVNVEAPPYALAVSVLGSSMTHIKGVAQRKLALLDEELIVEELRDAHMAVALDNLEGRLAGWREDPPD